VVFALCTQALLLSTVSLWRREVKNDTYCGAKDVAITSETLLLSYKRYKPIFGLKQGLLGIQIKLSGSVDS